MDPCSVLPAERYNELRQIDDIDPRFVTTELLTSIGSIFTKHNHQHSFAICMLHRHYELQECHIMMHKQDTRDQWRDTCTMQDVRTLSEDIIYPHSYLLEKAKLVPYEYGISSPPTCSREFETELGSLLETMGLTSDLSIIPIEGISNSEEMLYETVDPATGAMVCTTRNDDARESLREVVSWRFVEDEDGGLNIKAFKSCEKQPSGLHKVVYASGPFSDP